MIWKILLEICCLTIGASGIIIGHTTSEPTTMLIGGLGLMIAYSIKPTRK